MALPDFGVSRLGREAFELLARELTGSELQSLLLRIVQQRAEARAAADVVAQYGRDGFCRPAQVDLRESVEVDRQLLAAATDFEALELSPLAPLASCSSFALTTQNRVVSTLRGSESVADPTNVLALESALRLRAAPEKAVNLTTSMRVVRAQPIPQLPGYSQHFRIFVLTSGGPEEKDHAFTVGALEQHVRTMLAALDRLEQVGYAFGKRRVTILATDERAKLGDRVADHFGALATRERLDHAYYSGGLRYQVWVTALDGSELPLIDGGAFDWLKTLTSNRRAVFVASGAGAQLIPLRFRADGLTS